MKRIILFFSLIIWFNILADTEQVGNYTWTYRIVGNTAEIYGTMRNARCTIAVSPSPTGSITIPDMLGGCPVSSIGSHSFDGCVRLTEVTIPNSVTNIGYSAFHMCFGLENVKIHEGVKCIQECAFQNCTNLTALTIPRSVTKIESSAFSECSGLISISVASENEAYKSINGLLLNKSGTVLLKGVNGDIAIPEGVTEIGPYAFNGLSGLMNVTIPNSVINIGYCAFSRCTGLTGVIMPDSLMDIGGDAFDDCRGLISVAIPNSVTNIGRGAFSGTGLTSVRMPNSVANIENNVFTGCRNLSEVILSDSVKSIGYAAFSSCSSLTDVTIPNSVTNIGDWAFYGCSSLTRIAIPDCVTNIGYHAFSGCSSLKNVIMPKCIKILDVDVFAGCSSLVEVTIPDGVITIGTGAFRNCKGLKSVTIPSGVLNVWGEAFYECSGLTNVVISDSVTSLGFQAFYGCSALTSVTIPHSVTNIGNRVFAGCTELDRIYLSVDYGGSMSVFPSAVTTFRYKPNQIVSLDAAGGIVYPSTHMVKYGSIYGELPIPSRSGYTFKGWELGGDSIGTNTVVIMLDDHTLVSKWQPNPYTMIFDANGGDGGKMVTQNFGTVLKEPSVTRTGYTFTGWMPSVPSTVPASNVTYTAQWKINQYTVAFDSAGGTTVSPITQDYATAITPPEIPTREGYTFMGWTPSVPSTMPTANTTCVAQWKINQYTISFDSAGGTSVSPVIQDYATAITPPENPTRTGYTFTGWSPSVPSSMPAENTTYTAQWQINQYTVTFDANGGTGGKSGKQNFGSAIVSPTVTREWFNFMGWSPSVAATVPANDVTYTAQWHRYGAELTTSQIAEKKLRELYPDDYANLTTVVLKNGITELPSGFFDGCNNVTSLTLPSTLLEFGLDDLPSKIRASLSYDKDGFLIYNGWILDYKHRNASAVTIPEGIVGIGRGAFTAMFDLETVTMPESLKCIAKGAFEDSSWIQDLKFMSGLRYVGPFAFRGCSSLLRATFADGVENLGTNVFESCWKMQSVRLPFTVTNIGVNAFSGCSAIRGVTVPTQVETMQVLFPAAYTKIETAEVAEGETAVMDDMFAGCTALRGGATQTDMSMIPNTVTNIGARAFQGCTSLTAFVVPDSVVEIGEAVFQGCTSLWNVTLSRNLEAIPDKAFYGCTMLETMVVPQQVNYLGNQFFCGKDNGANALYYLCTNAPACHASAYSAITGNMTTYVEQGSRSWDGRQGSRVLPQSWNGYPITYWTPNRFDVNFDANGGRFELADGSAYVWSEQQITDTGYALPSTEPIRPGWAFEGWWTEQYGGAEVRYSTLVTATRTHTLYAHWRLLGEGMTVTFNSNGGTVVVPGSQDYVPGQTFGQFPVPTRRGYAFQGWWTEPVDGIHMTEATQVPAADMELFAHWSPITYVVRFHANGGNGGDVDQTFVFDVQHTLASHTFTRTGFAFTGWATTPSGQVRYAENASVVNLEEVQDKVVDLYAVWSGVGYSVRFDSNGGTGIMDNQTIAVGETQNLWPSAFARGGYNFAGWAISPTDAANGTVKYRDGAAVKNLATSNGAIVPLYAVWFSSDQTVRISFDANGGSVSPDYWDCLTGTAVEAFPTPTRPGFTFAGWWTAKTGGMEVESIAVVSASQTFYAHWAENGEVDPGDWSCTVSFNANGGSVAEAERTVVSGAAVGALPMPTRMGYLFLGWFTAAEEGVEVTAETIVTGSVTYYAHWSAHRYTVTFNANGGEGEMLDQMMTYGELAPLKAVAFTKSGSRFIGWAVEPQGGVVYHDGQSVQDLAADADGVVVLYAVWEATEMTLTDVLCDDARAVGFSADSGTDWVIDFTVGHDAPSARSCEIAAAENGGRTSTTLTATVTGEGTGSFWWKVNCENMDEEYDEWYDYAMFMVDGVAVAKIAGERDWEQVEFAVSGAGTHTLSWTFSRDDYDEDGASYENAAWVDGVIWTPKPVTVTFAAGGAEEGEVPEAVVKYQGYELSLPGAGTLVNGTCRFVGWTDGVATCEAGSTYIVPATNVTLTAVWELKVWTLGEAVNAATLLFATGGNADWSVSASNGSINGVAAKSGAVGDGEASWIETTVNGEGTLAFHWNVMGGIYRNTPFAYAKVEVDGIAWTQQHKTDGWEEQAVAVEGAGAHTIRWTYLRTSARTTDGDCAWLDEVVWMPSGGTVPELTPEQAASWVSNDLATRYAKSGESAADYNSRFEEKFGTDPVVAMARPTGKKDAQGNDMYVWQDYVAGTDPTDTNSLFTATIKMVDGAHSVEWSPKLSAAEESKRTYTVYGKASLEPGEEWHSPTNSLDRFFKVGVEMK